MSEEPRSTMRIVIATAVGSVVLVAALWLGLSLESNAVMAAAFAAGPCAGAIAAPKGARFISAIAVLAVCVITIGAIFASASSQGAFA